MVSHTAPIPTRRLLSQGECAVNFYQHDRACYRLTDKPVTRSASVDEAREACVALAPATANLKCGRAFEASASCPLPVTPHVLSTAAFMRVLASSKPSHDFWVGLKVLANDKASVFFSYFMIAIVVIP